MNPLGIAIFFIVLWSIVGAGLYLTFSRISALKNQQGPLGVTARLFLTERPSQVFSLIVNIVLLVVGLLMVVGGLYITFRIIY